MRIATYMFMLFPQINESAGMLILIIITYYMEEIYILPRGARLQARPFN